MGHAACLHEHKSPSAFLTSAGSGTLSTPSLKARFLLLRPCIPTATMRETQVGRYRMASMGNIHLAETHPQSVQYNQSHCLGEC